MEVLADQSDGHLFLAHGWRLHRVLAGPRGHGRCLGSDCKGHWSTLITRPPSKGEIQRVKPSDHRAKPRKPNAPTNQVPQTHTHGAGAPSETYHTLLHTGYT